MPTDDHRPDDAATARRHRGVALACAGFVVLMVGAAYAAVPLYAMFCRVTGFGGTPRIVAGAPGPVLDRRITVRFDANVAPGLNWDFYPEQREVEVKLGETKLVYFKAISRSPRETFGSAVYNVTPEVTGAYFSKIQCFCFDEQKLGPTENVDMPVVFFVDPALATDPELSRLNTITLSYTFYPAAPSAAAIARTEGGAPKL